MAFSPPDVKNLYQQKQLRNPLLQVVLLLVVIILFLWFVAKPQYENRSVRKADLAVVEADFAQMDSEKAAFENLVTELQNESRNIDLIDEAIPLSSRVTKVYVLINNIVQSSGMELAQITTDTSKQAGVSAGNKELLADPFQEGRKLQTTEISIGITGSIDQFRNFLQLAETSSRILDVETIEVIGGDEETRFRLQLKAYAYDVN